MRGNIIYMLNREHGLLQSAESKSAHLKRKDVGSKCTGSTCAQQQHMGIVSTHIQVTYVSGQHM